MKLTHTEFLAALQYIGITQTEFARFIGYQKHTVCRWANGVKPIPEIVGITLNLMLFKLDIMNESGAPAIDDLQLTPWDVLGVNQDADAAALKSSYRKLLKQYHPDAGGDHDQSLRITAAYSAALEELYSAEDDKAA